MLLADALSRLARRPVLLGLVAVVPTAAATAVFLGSVALRSGEDGARAALANMWLAAVVVSAVLAAFGAILVGAVCELSAARAALRAAPVGTVAAVLAWFMFSLLLLATSSAPVSVDEVFSGLLLATFGIGATAAAALVGAFARVVATASNWTMTGLRRSSRPSKVAAETSPPTRRLPLTNEHRDLLQRESRIARRDLAIIGPLTVLLATWLLTTNTQARDWAVIAFVATFLGGIAAIGLLGEALLRSADIRADAFIRSEGPIHVKREWRLPTSAPVPSSKLVLQVGDLRVPVVLSPQTWLNPFSWGLQEAPFSDVDYGTVEHTPHLHRLLRVFDANGNVIYDAIGISTPLRAR